MKLVVSMSKCLTKSSDSEVDDDALWASKLKAKNNRLRPKLDRLRPGTVEGDAKELASNSHKSSHSSSGAEKQKHDEKDDDNIKQIRRRKRCAEQKVRH